MDIDQFTNGYIECALWSSSIEEDFAAAWNAKHPGEDFAPDCSMQSFGFESDALDDSATAAIREECADFIAANEADLDAYSERMGTWRGSDTVRGANASYTGDEQAGADFWLTRNGHGAGFWDRGLGELGERLTEAAKASGSSDLYIGDDEGIYVT
jgi:hypothetical protein